MKYKLILFLLLMFGGIAFFYPVSEKKSPEPSSPVITAAPREPASKPTKNKDKPLPIKSSESRGDGDLSALQSQSMRPWAMSRSSNGVVRLSGGALYVDGRDYLERGRNFLRQYSRGVLGVREGSLVEAEKNARMIRYQQMENGTPVWNSKVSIFFDENGNIVHVIGETKAGSLVASRAAIDQSAAILIAKSAVSEYISPSGGLISSYSDSVFSPQLFLFNESGEFRWMYRFVVPLVQPQVGEYEVLIDAEVGQVFSAQNLARK